MSDYKKLRDEWYKRLADLGFEDIEGNEDQLKAWHSIKFQKKGKNNTNPANHESKANYYYYATHFLNNHKFEKEIHKLIWEEHTNGVGYRNITKMLTKDGAYDMDAQEVRGIINHYKEIFLKKL